MDNSLLIIDSGIGGLNIVSKIVDNFKNLTVYYASDSKNLPYGNKSVTELQRLSVSLLEKFDKAIGLNKVSAVVLGCNTLSTNCLEFLKQKFNLPIFGISPSVSGFNGKTLIFCTKQTAESKILLEYSKSNQVSVVPLCGLASAVEEHIAALDSLDLQSHLPIVERDFDTVVLGCTHYLFLSEKFSNIFPYSQISDGFDGLLTNLSKFLTTCDKSEKDTRLFFVLDDKMRNFTIYQNCFSLPKIVKIII